MSGAPASQDEKGYGKTFRRGAAEGAPLRLGYTERQWLRHAVSEARKALVLAPMGGLRTCAGCGVDLSQTTRGCKTCSERERGRRRFGREPVSRLAMCRRCGVPMDGKTPGCQACYFRHRKRRIRAAA